MNFSGETEVRIIYARTQIMCDLIRIWYEGRGEQRVQIDLNNDHVMRDNINDANYAPSKVAINT